MLLEPKRQLIVMLAKYSHICSSLKTYSSAISIRTFRDDFIEALGLPLSNSYVTCGI
jgi:hypothetical protein